MVEVKSKPDGASGTRCGGAIDMMGNSEKKLAWNRRWRERNREKIAFYNAWYNSLRREYDPDAMRDYKAKREAENPLAVSAQKLVRREVRAGRLQRQPCERCGSSRTVDGHHDNYLEPFSIRWLCRLHHKERHVELKRAFSRP
jgi:hypothetical protein